MENNENEERNYECENDRNDCKYMPDGINAAFGYMGLNDMNCNIGNECGERDELREKMLKEIKCLNFAIIELGLYLNTHPNDRKALCLHTEYANKLNVLKDKYQRIFGPLTIYYPCNEWRWLENPWPWERSDINVDL